MALSGAIVIGPDCNGRSVAIVDGRVVAAAPAGRGVPAVPGRRDRAGRGQRPHPSLQRPRLLRHAAARSAAAGPSADPGTVWWRLDRALDARTLRAAARDYVARALLAGTTTLIDHHESPNLIEGSLAILAEACQELGIRAMLCYGATERNSGRAEAQRGLAECRRVGASPLLRGLVGLHASFTVSDEAVREAGDLAGALGTVVHVHVAEDQIDVEDARRRGAAGPLERLMSLGAIAPGAILAHGVRLSADQARLASDAGCWFVHNPRSNEGNRVGYADALRAASRVALGTDGWDADMADEEAALLRLATACGDDGAGGRLAAGHALVAERFGAVAAPLAPGCAGRRRGAAKAAKFATWWSAAASWSGTGCW